ncbi:hypothetical protein ACWOA0_04060 [Ignavigranum ruoffiae]|uniref:Cell division protein FtsL n=1 Tax=Ignavigranum ruoffiae TaxID=89093 RepID=A0A1H9E4W3_9LACT|nr:hypothetical protein [Ignavigranum ruoffiae]UPQ85307.1 hypothetical protein M0R79_06530 [Ignavigranum ruoffiae]SEQ19948.1 Cell division protein FtsL [Ignavigranum ruoffiae]
MNEQNYQEQAPSIAVSVSNKVMRPSQRTFNRDISMPLDRISADVRFRSLKFSRAEMAILITSLTMMIVMIAGLLYLQYNNSQLLEATQQYKVNTAEIQKQSNLMTESITQQFNYDKIKETADENQMSIDKSRVRTVHE